MILAGFDRAATGMGEHAVEDRGSAYLQERLGAVVGQRSNARSDAGRQNHRLEWCGIWS